MNQSPSQSALNKAAATLLGIWAALWSGFGLFGTEPDPEVVLADWVSGIFRRLEELLVQFQAGELAACDDAGFDGFGLDDSQQNSGAHVARVRAADGTSVGRVNFAGSVAVVVGTGDHNALDESFDANVAPSNTRPEFREASAEIAVWHDFVGGRAGFSEKMA
jgi:hypothetical protein